jgi:hypothetical protein
MSTQLPDQQRNAGRLVSEYRIDSTDLWIEYMAIAGDATENELMGYLGGTADLPPLQRDLIDMALQTCLEKDWYRPPYGLLRAIQKQHSH